MKIIITESQHKLIMEELSGHKFIAVIKCHNRKNPVEKVEEFLITDEDIEDYLSESEDETVEDAINYYIDDYLNALEQQFCSAKLYDPREYYKLTGYEPSLYFKRR